MSTPKPSKKPAAKKPAAKKQAQKPVAKKPPAKKPPAKKPERPDPRPAIWLLACDIEVQGAARTPHEDRKRLPADSRIALRLRAPQGGNAYVLHVGSDQFVSVLLEATAAPRLPAAGWLVTPGTGYLVCLQAPAGLPRIDLARLAGGREPDAASTKGRRL